MRKTAGILVVSLLLAGLTGCGAAKIEPETAALLSEVVPETAAIQPTVPETQPETPPAPQEEHFLLTFVGDCTLGANPTNYYALSGFVKTVGEDYDYPFRNVLSYFEEDDATFANLEGALADAGNPADKTHTFRGPTAYSQILTGSSVDVVTLANNHSMDYGQSGYDSTRQTLESAGIPYVERDSSCLITLDGGLKIGLYGMVYYALEVQDMEAEIAALREQGAELVIMAPHWGTEGTYRPTQQQVDIGHAAIDAGADIVWGSHPHVLQPIEEYYDGVILYSMGNFCFGGNGAPEDLDSVLVQQEIVRSPDGEISLGTRKIVPCTIGSEAGKNNFQPTPMEVGTEEYKRVLSKLSGTFQGPDLTIRRVGK